MDFSVLPLCSLCLRGDLEMSLSSLQRHREHRGSTEKNFKLGHHPSSTKLPSIHTVRIMSAPHAGVAKLVYALDSKSSEVHSSCRFESDLRHQTFTSS